MEKNKYFLEVLNTFENADMRYIAEECIELIPEYFFKIPASSTGKYHPSYALGEGGLLRHTLAVCRFINHHFEVDCYKNGFTSRERDLMRIAGMMHDSFKSGLEKGQYTAFDHPLIAANVIRESKICLAGEEKELLAQTIEAHMGQWNTDKRSEVVLPLPTTKYQMLLHMCDYLASRKDIEVKFEHLETEENNINTYLFPFGKYKGTPITEVPKDYLEWLKKEAKKNNKPLNEPLAGYIKRLVG